MQLYPSTRSSHPWLLSSSSLRFSQIPRTRWGVPFASANQRGPREFSGRKHRTTQHPTQKKSVVNANVIIVNTTTSCIAIVDSCVCNASLSLVPIVMYKSSHIASERHLCPAVPAIPDATRLRSLLAIALTRCRFAFSSRSYSTSKPLLPVSAPNTGAQRSVMCANTTPVGKFRCASPTHGLACCGQ